MSKRLSGTQKPPNKVIAAHNGALEICMNTAKA